MQPAGFIIRLPIMRLVSYDRGGARRLGAWVERTIVDLPDAVGHPAFPSTMESLVARHGGTTLEAARAALDHPDVQAFAVPSPRLQAAILPTSIWRLPGDADPRSERVGDPLDRQLEIACLLAERRGESRTSGGDRWSIFGFTLVDWWAEGFGPTIVTTEELEHTAPGLLVTVDGRPWMRVSIDIRALMWTIGDLWQREAVAAGAVVVFDAVAVPFSRIRRVRVRPGALVDLEPDPARDLRDVAGTS
jgi:hypothetical protein